MANNDYPNVTLPPLQRLDFRLANGDLVRTMLKPFPDQERAKVSHVELEDVETGSSLSKGRTLTVIQAGSHAYEFAKSVAQRTDGGAIVEAMLEGQEFLEKADVEQITGNAIKVTLF